MVRTPRKGALGKIFLGGCFRRRHVARRCVIGVPLKADATAASGAIDLLRLRVDTECTDGAAVFKVINIGGRWPRPGTFTIYTLDGQKRISKRRMLLTRGRTAS